MNLFARFAQDKSCATAIEYGLIAALISVSIIVADSISRRQPRRPVQRHLRQAEQLGIDDLVAA